MKYAITHPEDDDCMVFETEQEARDELLSRFVDWELIYADSEQALQECFADGWRILNIVN